MRVYRSLWGNGSFRAAISTPTTVAEDSHKPMLFPAGFGWEMGAGTRGSLPPKKAMVTKFPGWSVHGPNRAWPV